MEELNEKCRQIYRYITDRINEGVPPSVREICNDLSIKSTSTVHRYLMILERNGLIEREYNQNRYIKLQSAKTLQVPLMGTVTAGIPITAIENIEGYVPFKAKSSYPDRELFALHVRGESMLGAGILDGDIVIVRRTPTSENGEIVVAMIEGEATVKRFYRENGHFRLQPENDAFEPIICDELTILGKVISLYREYE